MYAASKRCTDDIPLLPQSAPACLGDHPDNVQACSASERATGRPLDPVDRAISGKDVAQYIDPIPRFCSLTCTAVIATFTVYLDQFHVTATYARHLELVLGQAVRL